MDWNSIVVLGIFSAFVINAVRRLNQLERRSGYRRSAVTAAVWAAPLVAAGVIIYAISGGSSTRDALISWAPIVILGVVSLGWAIVRVR